MFFYSLKQSWYDFIMQQDFDYWLTLGISFDFVDYPKRVIEKMIKNLFKRINRKLGGRTYFKTGKTKYLKDYAFREHDSGYTHFHFLFKDINNPDIYRYFEEELPKSRINGKAFFRPMGKRDEKGVGTLLEAVKPSKSDLVEYCIKENLFNQEFSFDRISILDRDGLTPIETDNTIFIPHEDRRGEIDYFDNNTGDIKTHRSFSHRYIPDGG